MENNYKFLKRRDMKKLLVLWLLLVALTVWTIPTFAANAKGKHHKGRNKTQVTQQAKTQ